MAEQFVHLFDDFAAAMSASLKVLILQEHELLPFYQAQSTCANFKIDAAIDYEFRKEAFGSLGIYDPVSGAGAACKSELIETIRQGSTELRIDGEVVALEEACELIGGAPQGPCERKWIQTVGDQLPARLAQRENLAIKFSERHGVIDDLLPTDTVHSQVNWWDSAKKILYANGLVNCTSQQSHQKGICKISAPLQDGELALLVKVRDVNAGAWIISAKLLVSPRAGIPHVWLDDLVPNAFEIKFLHLVNGLGLYRQGHGPYQLLSAHCLLALAFCQCFERLKSGVLKFYE